MKSFGLRIFDQPIRIDSKDPIADGLIAASYSAFRDDQSMSDPGAVLYVVDRPPGRPHWDIHYLGLHVRCDNLADLAYFLEKALTIELQKIRRDLFFVHAAAISFDGRCTLIAGESGAGKSTLCWGLCNEGGTYLSDELAPVNLDTMTIAPYPHAICLKSIAEGGYPAPPGTIETERTMHIPIEAIPGSIEVRQRRLHNIVFVLTDTELNETSAIEISASEAATRLYANSLNQLAHANDGLAAVSRIARAARCYILHRSQPEKMRRAIRELVNRDGM